MLGQIARDLPNQLRVNQGFVPLHVDDNLVIAPAALLHHFGNTVGAGRVIGTCHDGFVTMHRRSLGDAGVIRGNADFGCTARCGPFGDAHDHGLAGDIQQRLAWQAG